MSNSINSASFEVLSNLEAWGISKGVEEVARPVGVAAAELKANYFVTDASHYGIEIEVDHSWALQHAEKKSDFSLQSVESSIIFDEASAKLRLTLLESSLLLTFSAFLDSIIDEFQSSPGQEGELAFRRLGEWIQLFRKSRINFPTQKIQAGLVVELLVLKNLMMLQPGFVLADWTGPAGKEHDFELAGLSIECKATLSRERLEISVNGGTQLLPSAGKDLILIVQPLDVDPRGKFSIPKLVREITELFPGIGQDFFEKLSATGVTLEHLTDRASFARFNLREGYEFEVTSAFPVLSVRDQPGRVHSINYKIDLADPATVPGFIPVPKIVGRLG